MKICINVGHGSGDVGAINHRSGETEHQFNQQLSKKLRSYLEGRGHNVDIVWQDGRGLNALPATINAMNPDLIVSLHSNGAEPRSANGFEMLYWHTSRAGKQLAESVQRSFASSFPDRKNRGTKPRDNLYLLRKTAATCIICEPFFITNDEEYSWAIHNMDLIAIAIGVGIDNYIAEAQK